MIIFCIIVVYIIGMIGGMFFAVSVKGENTRHHDGWWRGRWEEPDWETKHHNDLHIPVLIVIFWWVLLIVLPLIFIVGKSFDLVVSSFEKTLALFERLLFKVENWKKLSVAKKEKAAAAKKLAEEVVTAIPDPSVKEDYRTPGAKPCKACGAPTSLDQSDISIRRNSENPHIAAAPRV